jgi:hypothetical protein
MLPASTFAEGPLGLEGLHKWKTFVMNNKTSGYPRVKIGQIAGLRTKPEADDNRDPFTGRAGEIIYPSLIRGKVVAYEGLLQAMSAPSLRTLQTDMLRLFTPTEEGKLAIYPPAARGGVTFTAFARCLELDIPEEPPRSINAVPSPYQLEFTLTLRMHVPMFFALGMPQTKTTVGTDPNTDVFNPSTAPTYPKLTVPFTAPTTVSVYNDTVGAVLRFDNLPTTGSLIVDFLTRTATVGGVDVLRYMNDVVSNWWDEGVPGLDAGNNIIRQVGGSQIKTDFFPTVW